MNTARLSDIAAAIRDAGLEPPDWSADDWDDCPSSIDAGNDWLFAHRVRRNRLPDRYVTELGDAA